LYFYDNQVLDITASLMPSARGVEILGRGVAWLDTGTHEPLLQASTFIEAIETPQGLKVCYPEEIAFRSGFIDAGQLERLARPLAKTGHRAHVLDIVQGTA
jgi:glucose-1-phosphate thymidylyltransferase